MEKDKVCVEIASLSISFTKVWRREGGREFHPTTWWCSLKQRVEANKQCLSASAPLTEIRVRRTSNFETQNIFPNLYYFNENKDGILDAKKTCTGITLLRRTKHIFEQSTDIPIFVSKTLHRAQNRWDTRYVVPSSVPPLFLFVF